MDFQRFNEFIELTKERVDASKQEIQNQANDIKKTNVEIQNLYQKLAACIDAAASKKDLQQLSKTKANREELQQLTAIVSTTDVELHKIAEALNGNLQKRDQME